MGERWSEFQNPSSDRLVGDVDPALGQEFLHVTVAERKAQIKPDRMSDDLGRELMSSI
jgi:hypothetical protein